MLTIQQIKTLILNHSLQPLFEYQYDITDLNKAILEIIADPELILDLNTTLTDPKSLHDGMNITWLMAYKDPHLLLQLAEKGFTFDLDVSPNNPTNSCYRITAAWLIAYKNPHLLLQLAEKGFTFDLDASSTNPLHQHYSMTVAWLIAHKDPNLLSQLAERGFIIDPNASPNNPTNLYHGVTVAWLIAHENPVSLSPLQLIGRGFTLNLNAAPKHPDHEFYRVTLAQILIRPDFKDFVVNQDQCENMRKYLKETLIFQHNTQNLCVNFEQASPNNSTNSCHEITTARSTACENPDLLLQLAEKGSTLDPNDSIINSQHPYYGITAAWLIALKNPDLLLQFTEIGSILDPDASIINPQHPYYGITAAWLIAFKNPDVLLQFTEIGITFDLNASPNNPINPYYGITVAWLIAHGNPNLLLQLAEQGFTFDLDTVPKHPDHELYKVTVARILIKKGFKDFVASQDQHKNTHRHLKEILAFQYKTQKYSINFEQIMQTKEAYQGFSYMLKLYVKKHDQFTQASHHYLEKEIEQFTLEQLNVLFDICQHDQENKDARFASQVIAYFILQKYLECSQSLSPNDYLLNLTQLAYAASKHIPLGSHFYQKSVDIYNSIAQSQTNVRIPPIRTETSSFTSITNNPNGFFNEQTPSPQYKTQNYSMNYDQIMQEREAYQRFLCMLEIYANKYDQFSKESHDYLEKEIEQRFNFEQLLILFDICKNDQENKNAYFASQAIAYFLLRKRSQLLSPNDKSPKHIELASNLLSLIPRDSHLYQPSLYIYTYILRTIINKNSKLTPEQKRLSFQPSTQTPQICTEMSQPCNPYSHYNNPNGFFDTTCTHDATLVTAQNKKAWQCPTFA